MAKVATRDQARSDPHFRPTGNPETLVRPAQRLPPRAVRARHLLRRARARLRRIDLGPARRSHRALPRRSHRPRRGRRSGLFRGGLPGRRCPLHSRRTRSVGDARSRSDRGRRGAWIRFGTAVPGLVRGHLLLLQRGRTRQRALADGRGNAARDQARRLDGSLVHPVVGSVRRPRNRTVARAGGRVRSQAVPTQDRTRTEEQIRGVVVQSRRHGRLTLGPWNQPGARCSPRSRATTRRGRGGWSESPGCGSSW